MKIGLFAFFVIFQIALIFGTVGGEAYVDGEDWRNFILNSIEANRTRENLRWYTSFPHSAGTKGDYQTAVETYERFKSYGLVSSIRTHEVLITTPIKSSITMLSPSKFECSLKEDYIPQDPSATNTPGIIPTFNAYSADGDVTAELVYVNFARKEDFERLKSMGIDLKGKIAICRYGWIFRGTKAMIAQEYGIKGLIIYTDVSYTGCGKGTVFPFGPWGTNSTVERGSVQYISICPGDPRRKVCQPDDPTYNYKKSVPAIPVIPISWNDALPLVSNLKGAQVNDPEWRGTKTDDYVGPGPAVLNMVVQQNWTVTTIWNVIGYIKGKDLSKTVVFGNHRDAWVFGAADPNSGTAAMLESARVLGLMSAKGWVPERNIMFASWDGEEYGLLGSTAFVESGYLSKFQVVSYVNVDTAVKGKDLGAQSTPCLERFFMDVLKRVPDPDTGKPLSELFQKKKIGTLGSGSDYTSFLHRFGSPSLNFGFAGYYGVYHSAYDDFYYMSNFGDPTFEYHKAAAQIIGLVAFELGTQPLLPLNYTTSATRFLSYFEDLKKTIQTWGKQIDLTQLSGALNTFQRSAAIFDGLAANSAGNATLLRDLNNRLIFTERQFLNPKGIPKRPYFQHLIQAPGLYQGYGAQTFPGLTQTAQSNQYDLFQQQYKNLCDVILRAAKALLTPR